MIYSNPVKIIYSENWLDDLLKSKDKLSLANPILVTSPGNRKRLGLDFKLKFYSIFSEIGENPNFDDCSNAINFCQGKNIDGVIALGGGSVMDLAKVIIVYLSTGLTKINELLDFKDDFPRAIPSIFLPTTHGTGSEVTMWGTVWNMEAKKKYSISHRNLYPKIAILDGNLTVSLPLDISIITILDALSHSFESIWNKNANQRSTEYAIEAINIILNNVHNFKQNPNDLKIRNLLLKASTLAGLAFSNTKTAAAHSISYPLTIRYGIPHGVASSISLIPLLKLNGAHIKEPLENLCKTLNISLESLFQKIIEIPSDIIPYSLSEWGIRRDGIQQLVIESFTKGRMDNNIVDLTKEDVLELLKNIY